MTIALTQLPKLFGVSGAHVRDLLRAVGLEHQVGYFGRHLSIDQVITEFEQSCPKPS